MSSQNQQGYPSGRPTTGQGYASGPSQGGFSNPSTNPTNFAGNSPGSDSSSQNQAGYASGRPTGQGYNDDASQGGFSNAGANPTNFVGNNPGGDFTSQNQAGYPSGKPNNQLSLPNNSDRTQGSYPNGQSPQGNYPSNGFGASGQGSPQNEDGYPRGGPSAQNRPVTGNLNGNGSDQSDRPSFGDNARFNQGPSAQGQNRNGYENAQSPQESVVGGSAGYPRGGPNGPRGSGY